MWKVAIIQGYRYLRDVTLWVNIDNAQYARPTHTLLTVIAQHKTYQGVIPFTARHECISI
jgi:hypothetical protein